MGFGSQCSSTRPGGRAFPSPLLGRLLAFVMLRCLDSWPRAPFCFRAFWPRRVLLVSGPFRRRLFPVVLPGTELQSSRVAIPHATGLVLCLVDGLRGGAACWYDAEPPTVGKLPQSARRQV